jgi:hypothetical protein
MIRLRVLGGFSLFLHRTGAWPPAACSPSFGRITFRFLTSFLSALAS